MALKGDGVLLVVDTTNEVHPALLPWFASGPTGSSIGAATVQRLRAAGLPLVVAVDRLTLFELLFARAKEDGFGDAAEHLRCPADATHQGHVHAVTLIGGRAAHHYVEVLGKAGRGPEPIAHATTEPPMIEVSRTGERRPLEPGSRQEQICLALLDAMAPPFDASADPPSWLTETGVWAAVSTKVASATRQEVEAALDWLGVTRRRSGSFHGVRMMPEQLAAARADLSA